MDAVMRHYRIYHGAADLEPGYAVREVLIGPGRVEVGEVLEQGMRCLADARDVIPPQADTCIHRSEEDDPAIVETWI
jgi:hypothetical protein